MATQKIIDEKDKISLLDILHVLAKQRKLIFIITAAGISLILLLNILAIILPPTSPFNLLPDIYKPTVRILVDSSLGSKSDSSLSTSALSSMFLGTGSAVQKNSTVILLEEIIKGNTIKDIIADEFGFYEKYNLTKADAKKTLARKKIEDKFKLEYNPGSALGATTIVINLSYIDTDKILATDILARIIELLGIEFKNIMLERVYAKKKYLEESIAVIEKDYNQAQKALIDFQANYGPNLQSQAEEQTKYIAKLQAEIYAQELLIRSLYLPENDPQIIQLRDQIAQKKQLINEMKQGFRSFSKSNVPLSEIPELQREYLRLELEVRIQNELYSMMRKELEKVKIEEADTMPVFQVLDKIEIPETKDAPSRAMVCIIFTITVLIIAIFIAFISEYFQRIKENPIENEKLHNILNILRPFKRKKS